MEDGSSDLQQARKQWRDRNSDGRNTFDGDQTQSPPSFAIEEHDLPLTAAQRLGQPSDTPDPQVPTDLSALARVAPDGHADVHVHVYAVENPDA